MVVSDVDGCGLIIPTPSYVLVIALLISNNVNENKNNHISINKFYEVLEKRFGC